MIDGVEINYLVKLCDSRGFFQEIIRFTDDFFAEGFGQWSLSVKNQDYYTEEFHLHRDQVDWWFCPVGLIKAVLFDGITQEFQELLLDGNAVLKIPAGIAHGLKVIEGPAYLMYITSKVYNPNDEGRITLEYDWSK